MFINLEKVNHSFVNSIKVLNDISFAVPQSKTLAIVGASGSGKSTILRLVAGILSTIESGSGNITINGKLPSNYLLEGKLAFMFQQPTLFPNLTVRENRALPLQIHNRIDQEGVAKR